MTFTADALAGDDGGGGGGGGGAAGLGWLAVLAATGTIRRRFRRGAC